MCVKTNAWPASGALGPLQEPAGPDSAKQRRGVRGQSVSFFPRRLVFRCPSHHSRAKPEPGPRSRLPRTKAALKGTKPHLPIDLHGSYRKRSYRWKPGTGAFQRPQPSALHLPGAPPGHRCRRCVVGSRRGGPCGGRDQRGPPAKAPGGAGLGGQAAEGAPLCQPEP